MSSNSPVSPGRFWRFGGPLMVLGLALLLAALFHESFSPGKVLFANDNPIGTLNATWRLPPQAFWGSWTDLNTIGGSSGTQLPETFNLLLMALGPVLFAKFYALLSLLFLGASAWLFFRCAGLSPAACALGGLAAALNSNFFSAACWGVATQEFGVGFVFLALAALSSAVGGGWRWLKVLLAGFAVGMNIMEGADIGAIFSLLVAAFVFFQALNDKGSLWRRTVQGTTRVGLVAIFAAILAAQTLVVLVGTQIQGVAGMSQQDEQSQAEHWDWATQWSLPKSETLSLMVPGLFGYRMDTPGGGQYWGAVGRAPSWDRYFAAGEQGPRPRGFMRQTGGGFYAGVAVLLLAVWAGVQSLRRKDSVFSLAQRKWLWFWMAVALVSLLLAYGRFAPFYRLFYALPHASNIRNPAKFLGVLSFALVVLFAYGVDGLWRRYVQPAWTSAPNRGGRAELRLLRFGAFERRWLLGCLVALSASLAGWWIYASSQDRLVGYLTGMFQLEGRSAEDATALAQATASFSLHQVGWFVLFFVLAAGLMGLILRGAFAGTRAKWAGLLLGLVLVADLARADQPWIVYWNYPQKYATNTVIDLLRDKPYEHRVALLPFQTPPQLGLLREIYNIEWVQQLFPWFNIQSLDIVQMPRMPADLMAFEGALRPDGTTNTLFRIARRWQLTNTRYLLGPAGFLDGLNQQFDPVQHRFHIAAAFDIVPKPGITQPTQLEELTAVLKPDGQYALFDFAGALPRAKLYTHWQVSTNDQATLAALGSREFEPEQTVLVANPIPAAPADTNQPGKVEFLNYTPMRFALQAEAPAPAVLLLNDRFDPEWKVLVDGKPAPLLRCNYIMRGVQLAKGSHRIEFRFQPSIRFLYVTFAAQGLGILLVGCLVVLKKTKPGPPAVSGSLPAAAKP